MLEIVTSFTCLHIFNAIFLNSTRRPIISLLYKGNEMKCVGGIFCRDVSMIISIFRRHDDTLFFFAPVITRQKHIGEIVR